MTKGHVISGTPIAVNYWKPIWNQQVELFFLSHFSRDNVEGLTTSWNKKIYTSNITAQLLKLNFPSLSSNIEALSFGSTHALPLESDDYIWVTLFNANHCPGSAVLLFEGYFGTVLYTGDFRYFPDLLPQILLHKASVDCLYFDNTYCSPHCNFPEKEVILGDIVNYIKQYIGKVRIIIGSDSLGKEELLVKLFQEIKESITVNSSRMASLEKLNLSYLANVETTPKNNSLILVQNEDICGQKIKKWNAEMPTQIVLLTAKYFGGTVKPFKKHKNVCVFPYSSHSSFNELVTFVKEIKPKKIFPIVAQPVKGMFDKNQGSVESLTCLIACVKERVYEEIFIEYCVPECLGDTEELLNVLVKMNSLDEEYLGKGKHDENSNLSCTTLPNNVNKAVDSHSLVNVPLDNDIRVVDCCSSSSYSCKRDVSVECLNQLNVTESNDDNLERFTSLKEVPYFPENLNEYFFRNPECLDSKKRKSPDTDDGCLIQDNSQKAVKDPLSCLSGSEVHCITTINSFSTSTSSDTNDDDRLEGLKRTSKNAISEHLPMINEIPSRYLSLIRKCQRKKLRDMKKRTLEFKHEDEEEFLNQKISICYEKADSSCRKFSISKKELLF